MRTKTDLVIRSQFSQVSNWRNSRWNQGTKESSSNVLRGPNNKDEETRTKKETWVCQLCM